MLQQLVLVGTLRDVSLRLERLVGAAAAESIRLINDTSSRDGPFELNLNLGNKA